MAFCTFFAPLTGLIIVAGEGKTGTDNISKTLASFGMCVGHWNKAYNCTKGKAHQWFRAQNHIMDAKPEVYGSIDYHRLLNGIDAVADVPIPTVFPFLYDALKTRSFVILSTRPSNEWAQRRYEWAQRMGAEKIFDPIPLQYPRNYSLRERYKLRVSTFNDTPISTGAHAYAAYNAYVRSTVPRHRLLEIDMFSNKSSYKAYLSFPLRATLYEFVRAKRLVRQADPDAGRCLQRRVALACALVRDAQVAQRRVCHLAREQPLLGQRDARRSVHPRDALGVGRREKS